MPSLALLADYLTGYIPKNYNSIAASKEGKANPAE